MLRPWVIATSIGIAGCAHAMGALPASTTVGGEAAYTATMFDDWSGARVSACIVGVAIERMVPTDEAARSNLIAAWSDGQRLAVDRGRIPVPTGRTTSCIDYEVRFAPNWFRVDDAQAVISSQRQWLWRPDPFPDDLQTSLRFILADGSRASLPWPEVDGAYRLDASAFFMDAYAVFGEFERDEFSVAGTSIDVVRLAEPPSPPDVRRWLERAIEAVASVGRRFPRPRLHFVIKPIASPASPVAFGMVRRGGGASILLLPSSHATAGPLERDWVAVHELSHLWLPRVYVEDRWLSEGIATYLQEVLRARCGLQTSTRAWRRLREGFERGRRSGTGRELAFESQQMHRTGAYQRVYWAGAAFALEADIRLREKSRSEHSLLTAIDGAQSAWGDDPGPISAREVLRSLDEATGAGFLVTLGEAYANASRFPDVSLADDPAKRAVRAEITAPAPDGCSVSGESSR